MKTNRDFAANAVERAEVACREALHWIEEAADDGEMGNLNASLLLDKLNEMADRLSGLQVQVEEVGEEEDL